MKDGEQLYCETSDSRVLCIPGAEAWDGATYSCRVCNPGGTSDSRCLPIVSMTAAGTSIPLVQRCDSIQLIGQIWPGNLQQERPCCIE